MNNNDRDNDIKTSWTRQQVSDLLEKEDLAYQKIELPFGFSTGGTDRSLTCKTIFDENVDIKGKSVLDVGCFLGYFCLEAKRRGAAKVLGIDVNENRLRQARLLADCLQIPIDYKLLDIESEDAPGEFDVTLLLNVLHHIHNPISLLDKLLVCTKDCLVMEMAGPSSPKVVELLKSLGASWWLRRKLNNLPVIVVGRDVTVTRKKEQKLFFSWLALRHLLLEQHGSVARFDVIYSNFKNRYIAIARKYHINKLLVVGGATASGKSTLIEGVMKGNLPEIASYLGVNDQAQWIESRPRLLKDSGMVDIDKLLYHYDLLRPWGNDARIYAREQGIELLECARDIKVATCWCEPEVMRKRLESELQTVKRHWHRQRIKNVLDLYNDGRGLSQRLNRWCEYCFNKNAEMVYIDTTREPVILTRQQWDQKLQQLNSAN